MRKEKVETFIAEGEFEVREMTGIEEDMFSDEKLVKSGEVVDRILANCSYKDGKQLTLQEVKELKSPDRVALMLGIRRVSHGDIVEINGDVQCSNRRCNELLYASVNLAELSVEYPKNKDDMEFEVEIAGRKVVYTYLDGYKEAQAYKNRNQGDDLTLAMLVRIVSVEGIHPNGIKKWLKELSVSDRRALRDAMKKADCGIDTSITLECPACKKQNLIRIESVPGFFFPKE